MQGFEGSVSTGINILYNYNALNQEYDAVAFESVRQATKEEVIMFIDGYENIQ